MPKIIVGANWGHEDPLKLFHVENISDTEHYMIGVNKNAETVSQR
jgi:hypothetical protein